MAYHPYTPFHNNSGVTFFGANPSEPTYVSSPDFVYNSGTSSLSVPNLIIASNGYIGSAGDPDAISIAANGNTVFSQNVSVNGNFTVNGTTTTVNSTTVTVEDPIITLGSGAPTTDDNKDRGIAFNWYDGVAKTGFMGFDDSAGKFTLIPEAKIENEVVTSGTAGILVADLEGNADTATDADQLDGQHGSYYLDWGNFTNKPDPTVTVELNGDVNGTGTYVWTDLSGNPTITISTEIGDNTIVLGDDTEGDYVASIDVDGTGLSIDETSGEGSTPVITSNATPVNGSGTLVARDTSTGGFSAGDVVFTKLNVDNIQIDGNTISATNTNGNIIITPNASGALQADSGGDARGTNAVDWQMVRASGTQVASGAYSVIGGGRDNTASGDCSTVGGGYRNTASGGCSTISGGRNNTASGLCSTVSGGGSNDATGESSTISGGVSNLASGNRSTVSGGRNNWATNSLSFVGGGSFNISCGFCSTISGGYSNLASGGRSTVGGGSVNQTSGCSSSILGGSSNCVTGDYGNIVGGRNNSVLSADSSIVGGSGNTVSGYGGSIIGGGCNNAITGTFSISSTISGGYGNCINDSGWSVIAGGDYNKTSAVWRSFIGGGISNEIGLDGCGGVIAGGTCNRAYNTHAAILGGLFNVASGDYSAIAGGCYNTVLNGGHCSSIGGGLCNTVSGGYSSIVGGLSNNTSEDGSFIGGGNENVISAGSYASILGGDTNKICGDSFLLYGSYSNILGGRCNTVTAQYASTMSGYNNSITGNYSIVGGRSNTLSGLYNFSVGAVNDDDGNNFVQLLGSGLTATQGHTTYVENLIATGVVTANEFVGDLTGNADTATTAVDASGLTSSVTIQVSDQVSGSATFQDAGDTANIAVSLTDASITGQAPFSGTVEGANDYLLIYDNGVGLRKISAQEFVGDLDIVTSFEVTDGTTTVQINQDEALTFSDGTGAEFVVTDVGGQPTVTVNSVDSGIVHDNLSGFVANEHINHSSVTFTAGSGISGGGDLTTNRRFDIDISEYSATGVGAGDSFLMLDNDGSTEQRSTVDQLGTYMAGTNITNTAGVLSVPDSTIDGVVFETANFVDSDTVDFTVTAGISVTAIVKDLSITEGKRSRTVDTNVTGSKTANKDITLVNAASGNVTISLPENATSGRVITIKRTDGSTNNVVISRSGADSIDTDFTTVQLYHKNETMTFVSDGSDWWSI